MEVWSVDRSLTHHGEDDNNIHLTWNNAPKQTTLFGYVRNLELPDSEHDAPVYQQDVRRIVNYKDCQSKMTFRVAIAAEIGHGGLEFRQESTPSGGWALKYNC